jgi:hypothetical protein
VQGVLWHGPDPSALIILDAFQVCGGSFTLLRRKHHCRRCGCTACGKCSTSRLPLHLQPELGYSSPQRACDTCVEQVAMVGAAQEMLEAGNATGAIPKLEAAIAMFALDKVNARGRGGRTE